jgi:outer membrane protein OmpA-like peptidoglycan-associated protein
LRAIMVPESQPGASRSIVFQRPDVDLSTPNVQRASTDPQPTPRRRPVAKATARPVVEAAASADADQPRAAQSSAAHSSAAHPTPVDEPGAVAFHVNFALDSAMIPDSAREMIDVIARLMKESPEVKIRIEGHTDALGSVGYNMALSERRALSVGAYLVKCGVEPSRLDLVGKGMAEPLTSNKYDPANRRVQFVRIG